MLPVLQKSDRLRAVVKKMPPKRTQRIALTSTDSDSDSDYSLVRKDAEPPSLRTTEGGSASFTWLQPNQTIGSVIRGLADYCKQTGLQCTPRVRSSDKWRATIACKQQVNGCPLRLTVKKNMFKIGSVTPNADSFVCGSCESPGPSISSLIRSALTAQTALESLSASAALISGAPTVSAMAAASSATPSVGVTDASSCVDCRDPAVITCVNGEHHWCGDCLKNLADSQIGEFDLFRRRRFTFVCPYDGSQINSVMEKLDSKSDEARNLEANNPINAGDTDFPDPVLRVLNRIRHVAIPRCPNCDTMICDFDACSAITCGRRLVVGERVDYAGGCGSNICAWCWKALPQHEHHHEHVRTCPMNPDPGCLYPPQPHPETWLASMSILARERVFNIVEQIRSSECRRSVYSAARKEHPELHLSEEWLASRHMWLLLTVETNVQNFDVHRAERCRILLQEMGFLDSEVLRRAILFCDCEINDIISAMRAICEQQDAGHKQK